VKERANRLHLE